MQPKRPSAAFRRQSADTTRQHDMQHSVDAVALYKGETIGNRQLAYLNPMTKPRQRLDALVPADKPNSKKGENRGIERLSPDEDGRTGPRNPAIVR